MGNQRTALAFRAILNKIKRNQVKHLTIEVTKRCNAKCDFCTYWKENKESEELKDYGPIVTHFNPLVVTLSGGEPLLRKDLEQIIKGIRQVDPNVYIGMVTNGALLTVEKARSLLAAGLNRLSISLDFPDNRHDRGRGIPGLFDHINRVLPELVLVGFQAVSINTFICDDNLEEISGLLEFALIKQVSVGLSCYSKMKTGNKSKMVSGSKLERLRTVVSLIKQYKKRYGLVGASDYYLDNIEEYFTSGNIPGCRAGIDWLQVTSAGHIKPCSELPVTETDYRQYDSKLAKPVSCSECWFSCRGESQAPLTVKRIKELWE
jgi:MoaA/NifB/PqqE/SkfB family radical SAM enzyme